MNAIETSNEGGAAVEFVSETEVGLYREEDWEVYSFDQVWGSQSTQVQVFEQVRVLCVCVVLIAAF